MTYGVVWLNERIVASNNLDIAVLDAILWLAMLAALVRHCNSRIAEDDTTNAAEAVNANLYQSVRLF